MDNCKHCSTPLDPTTDDGCGCEGEQIATLTTQLETSVAYGKEQKRKRLEDRQQLAEARAENEGLHSHKTQAFHELVEDYDALYIKHEALQQAAVEVENARRPMPTIAAIKHSEMVGSYALDNLAALAKGGSDDQH